MSFPIRTSLSVAALGLWSLSIAQQNDIPLNRDIYYDIDRNGSDSGSTMYTGLRPIIASRADLRNVMGYTPDSARHYYWISKKLFADHLLEVREGGFRLTIDPVFNLEYGREFNEATDFSENANMNHNGRGFWVTADLGPTVSFQTSFYENQAALPAFLYFQAQRGGSVPGQGRIKDFNERGLDFAWAMGNVSWTPRTWLNVQIGQGRHFVGNGYRSMLLSDNTSPYPYIKLSAITTNKRFQYSAINAKLTMFGADNRLPTGEGGESLFYWKRASFRHAGITLGPVQVGLFEATIWKNIDSTGVLPYDPLELNPVIGLNTIVNGFDGPSKQLVGIDTKVRLRNKLFVYGQFALDDPSRQRYAWQAGLQCFDLGRKDLHVLVEYNSATPFAYTKGDPRINYGHAGQALANPLGAGFNEALVQVDYGIRQRYWFRAMANLADIRVDLQENSISGGDIFVTDNTAWTVDAMELRQRFWLDLSFTYRMNPSTNLHFTAGWWTRDLTPAMQQVNSGYLYFALRTGLFNRYYDI
ncbi:MAG TPA: hypothetical protein VGE21_01710 [Flavobacteriales bacterium]